MIKQASLAVLPPKKKCQNGHAPPADKVISTESLEKLQEYYHPDDLLYLDYYTVAESGLPRKTQDTLRDFNFKNLSDICNLSTEMIGGVLKLGAVEGAELVSWVQEKKGFLANQIDILSVIQTRYQLMQGNALARQDQGYRKWMDDNNKFIWPTHVVPQSREALLEMLKESGNGSVERKVAIDALSTGIKVEKVVALDPKFIHG